ncbi:MAG TPA: serine/threonine-protein kinase [Nannocystaceae bacterium]|nr:serine/threonine-protein kinase [Nannocystaceae bacterium]
MSNENSNSGDSGAGTAMSSTGYYGYQGTDLPTGMVVKCVSQFEIVQRLGEGGMAKVYKAFDRLMNRYVALKVMKNDVPEWAHRHFRREARMCASFMHNNLVRVMQVGTTEEFGLLWFAMEYLRGKDVGWFIDNGTPVPVSVICEIFGQVCEALRYVHLRRIVHCDIKPSNVFVTRDSHDPLLRVVKVLDFGVARDLSDLTPQSKAHVMGDPRYIAPEQTIPGGYIDHRADLYALGMTFFELVTGGRHPFEDLFDKHPRTLLQAHRERDPLPVSRFMPPGTPAELGAAIDDFFFKACAKNVNQRFVDATSMKEAMNDLAKLANAIQQGS